LKDEFNLEEHDPRDVYWNKLDHVSKNLNNYKKVKKLYDFNDMIKMLTDKPRKRFQSLMLSLLMKLRTYHHYSGNFMMF
jgi:hypothetical protein